MRLIDAVSDFRLAGAPNFRDVGGYRTVSGWRLRTRLLFRSEDLSRLTMDDLAVLRELPIRVVVDLRSESECSRRPSRLPKEGVDVLRCGSQVVPGSAGRFSRLRDILAQDPSPAAAKRMMLETYALLPVQCAPAIGRVIQSLIGGGLPLLIHCTAGKDRTGFVCACLHGLLGVPEDQIYRDYLLSGEIFRSGAPERREAMLRATSEAIEDTIGLSVSRDALEVIGSVERDYLAAAFSRLHDEFGSIEHYARSCGVDKYAIEQFRERLLEAPQSR